MEDDDLRGLVVVLWDLNEELSFYILCAVRLSILIFAKSELAVLVLFRFFCCCEFVHPPAFSLL
jgi:hypothetical protein